MAHTEVVVARHIWKLGSRPEGKCRGLRDHERKILCKQVWIASCNAEDSVQQSACNDCSVRTARANDRTNTHTHTHYHPTSPTVSLGIAACANVIAYPRPKAKLNKLFESQGLTSTRPRKVSLASDTGHATNPPKLRSYHLIRTRLGHHGDSAPTAKNLLPMLTNDTVLSKLPLDAQFRSTSRATELEKEVQERVFEEE